MESEERSLDFARDDNGSFALDDNGSFALDDNGGFARDDIESEARVTCATARSSRGAGPRVGQEAGFAAKLSWASLAAFFAKSKVALRLPAGGGLLTHESDFELGLSSQDY